MNNQRTEFDRNRVFSHQPQPSTSSSDAYEEDELNAILSELGFLNDPSAKLFDVEAPNDVADLESLVPKLVLRWVTDGPGKFVNLKENLPRIWRLRGTVEFTQTSHEKTYIVSFARAEDFRKVWKGNPWLYRGDFCVVRPLVDLAFSESLVLSDIPLEIQFHGLPMVYVNPKMGEFLGNLIGEATTPEEKEVATWSDYPVIVTNLPIDEPLPCTIQFKDPHGRPLTTSLKYERLDRFCYFCGRLGHGQQFCTWLEAARNKLETLPEPLREKISSKIECKWSDDIRASPKTQSTRRTVAAELHMNNAQGDQGQSAADYLAEGAFLGSSSSTTVDAGDENIYDEYDDELDL